MQILISTFIVALSWFFFENAKQILSPSEIVEEVLVGISPDAKHLITYKYKNILRVREIPSHLLLHQLNLGNDHVTQVLAFSNNEVLVVYEKGFFKVVNFTNDETREIRSLRGIKPLSVGISHDMKKLCFVETIVSNYSSTSPKTDFGIYDITNGKLTRYHFNNVDFEIVFDIQFVGSDSLIVSTGDLVLVDLINNGLNYMNKVDSANEFSLAETPICVLREKGVLLFSIVDRKIACFDLHKKVLKIIPALEEYSLAMLSPNEKFLYATKDDVKPWRIVRVDDVSFLSQ
jgi:hypothetical protein